MFSSEQSIPNCSTGSATYKSYVSTPEDRHNELWYHGDITQLEAERILEGGHAGLFLVRRSGPSRYYLSYVETSGKVLHAPIRQLNSSFYFDGMRFAELCHVVEHFTVTASHTSHVAAVHSISPSPFAPTSSAFSHDFLESKYLCVRSFEQGDMRAKRGDVLSVSVCEDEDFLWVRNEANGCCGLAPSNAVQPIEQDCDSMSELPYFYDTMSIDIVQPMPLGSFLLRRSTKGDDAYALLVKTQAGLVEKFLILGSPAKGFQLAGRPFATIGHVINRYAARAISGGSRLSHAICRENDLKDDEDNGNRSQSSSSSQLRRAFNGAAIDTSLAASLGHAHGLPSPSTTVSTAATSPDDVLSGIVASCEDYDDDIATTSTVVAKTHALRKSREDKQWKDCWVTLWDLSSGGSQLTVHDTQTGTKRRTTFELPYCSLFWLDESVFGVDGSVFLTPNYSTSQQMSTFFCFRPFSNFVNWMVLLRSRALGLQPSISTLPNSVGDLSCITHMSLLFVEIDKYRSETLKPDSLYSANVLLNGVKMCLSNPFALAVNRQPNELPVVVIDSRFILPCIPSSSSMIQLAIHSHSTNGKKGRAFAFSPLLALPESGTLTLSPETGFSFRVIRKIVRVFPLERYAPLLSLLKTSPEELLRFATSYMPQQNKSFLFSCLVFLYLGDPHNMLNMFRKVVDDVLCESTPGDVFRKDSSATGLVTQCLRHVLKAKIDDFVANSNMFASSHSSHHAKNASNQEATVEALVEYLDSMLVSTPLALQVLSVVGECAQRRFVDETHLVRRTLSSLVILRFLNPVLLSSVNSAGQLAKAVQMAANAAASTVADEALNGAAKTVRRMFDRVLLHSFEEQSSDGSTSAEWLAIVAHLLADAWNTNSGELNVHQDVLDLLQAHL